MQEIKIPLKDKIMRKSETYEAMTKRKMREVMINIVYTEHTISRYVYSVERTTFYTHQGLRQNNLDNSISNKVYVYQHTNRNQPCTDISS